MAVNKAMLKLRFLKDDVDEQQEEVKLKKKDIYMLYICVYPDMYKRNP